VTWHVVRLRADGEGACGGKIRGCDSPGSTLCPFLLAVLLVVVVSAVVGAGFVVVGLKSVVSGRIPLAWLV